MLELIRYEIRFRIGTILGWTIGLGAFLAAAMIFYAALPIGVGEVSVGPAAVAEFLGRANADAFDGFLLRTSLSWLPLLVGILGAALGIGALAAEEDNGTLELLAALPLSRARLLLGKAIAATLMLLIILALTGLLAVAVLAVLPTDTQVGALDLFLAVVATSLIGFVFLSLSLFLGAYLPGRGTATAAAAIALLVSYFGYNLVDIVPGLAPYQPLFPHAYYGRIAAPLLAGEPAWAEIGVLTTLGLGALLLALAAFSRRSLGAPAWPWQRPRPPKGLRALASAAGGEPSGTNAWPAVLLALLGLVAMVGAVAAYSPPPATPDDEPRSPAATTVVPSPRPAPTGAASRPDAPTASVPPTATPSATPTADTETPPPTATATVTPAPTVTPVTYTVKAGDTLAQIAKDQGVTLAALIAANDIEDPARIEIGDVFVIPPAE